MGLKERLDDIAARVVFGPKIEGDVVKIAGQDVFSTETFYLGELEPKVRFVVRTDDGKIHTFELFKDPWLLNDIVPNFNTSTGQTEPARLQINQRGNWRLIRRILPSGVKI